MTEDKWLRVVNPLFLLSHVRRTPPGLRTVAQRRKTRLFAVACVRRLWPHLAERMRTVVETAERYADREADSGQLDTVWSESRRNSWRTPQPRLWFILSQLTDSRASKAAQVWRSVADDGLDAARGNTSAQEKRLLAALLRCIVGNPFRPVAFDPSWRTSAAVALAEGIYADRAFDRLPILADALEDAGCGHPDVLAHCRGDGPHARGCWVVDLILGKV